MASQRERILVLYTGNSRRSQMAEGGINHLPGRQSARAANIPVASR